MENLGENFDSSRFRFTATGDDSVRAFSRQITSLGLTKSDFRNRCVCLRDSTRDGWIKEFIKRK